MPKRFTGGESRRFTRAALPGSQAVSVARLGRARDGHRIGGRLPRADGRTGRPLGQSIDDDVVAFGAMDATASFS